MAKTQLERTGRRSNWRNPVIRFEGSCRAPAERVYDLLADLQSHLEGAGLRRPADPGRGATRDSVTAAGRLLSEAETVDEAASIRSEGGERCRRGMEPGSQSPSRPTRRGSTGSRPEGRLP